MSARYSEKQSTRREMLQNSAAFAGSACEDIKSKTKDAVDYLVQSLE
jgi:hypothetical protein